MTGFDKYWYLVLQNEHIISSAHISAKIHIVGVSLKAAEYDAKKFFGIAAKELQLRTATFRTSTLLVSEMLLGCNYK